MAQTRHLPIRRSNHRLPTRRFRYHTRPDHGTEKTVADLVAHCVLTQGLKPDPSDAERSISVTLAALVGDYDDPTIRSLSALQAAGVFTPETVIRLAIAHIRQKRSVSKEKPTATRGPSRL
jgi:hypothetical protein